MIKTENVSGLRRGYTTGSCAAAASLAAASLLLLGEHMEQVSILTPKGIRLMLAVEDEESGDGWARCAVRKSAGDDPDITDGILVYACVSLTPDGKKKQGEARLWYSEPMSGEGPTLYLRGGEGIGRVTREGLSCPAGMWAINPVPRRMIFEQVAEVCRQAGGSAFRRIDAVWITLEIPEGRQLAEKTFNPRLGIVGGLSVLGTSGIVEPMSEPALLETIRLEIHQKALEGEENLLLIPGNYGERFLEKGLALPIERAVKCSNYIGAALDMASAEGMKSVLLVGHAGKLIKLAAGIMNTHSRVADGRMECLAAYGAACGASGEIVRQILDCITVDEALGLLEQEEGLLGRTMERIVQQIWEVLERRTAGKLQAEAVLFTNDRGLLGMTKGAGERIAWFRKEGLNE